MTQNEFAHICLTFTIDPQLALENENIVNALQNRDDEKVIQILENEF
jgi:hypothetical protein